MKTSLTKSDFSTSVNNNAIINGLTVIGTIFNDSLTDLCKEYKEDISKNLAIKDVYCYRFKNGSKDLFIIRLLGVAL